MISHYDQMPPKEERADLVLEGESITEGGGGSRQLEQEVERSHLHPQPEIREPPGSGMRLQDLKSQPQ